MRQLTTLSEDAGVVGVARVLVPRPPPFRPSLSHLSPPPPPSTDLAGLTAALRAWNFFSWEITRCNRSPPGG